MKAMYRVSIARLEKQQQQQQQQQHSANASWATVALAVGGYIQQKKSSAT